LSRPFLALVPVLLISGIQAGEKALPPSRATALRKLFTQALVRPDQKVLSRLRSEARTLQGRYRFEDLAAALRKGPLLEKGLPKPRRYGRNRSERFQKFGTVISGFTLEVDGKHYRYAVDMPPGFQNDHPVPLLVDPGHGIAAGKTQEEKAGYLPFYRNMAGQAGGEEWLVARTEILEMTGAGTGQELSDDGIARVFDHFFRDFTGRFRVDLDRIYVSGLSQTGFWAWYLGRARPDRFAGIAPMSSVTWQVDGYLENFSNLPVYVLHGDRDGSCPVAQPRKTCEMMKKRGYPVTYREIAGGKHDASVWRHLGQGLRELSGTPRNPYPKKIAMKLQTDLTPWCYWIRVEGLHRSGSGKGMAAPTASMEAEIEGQRVTIRSEGIRELTLCLSGEMLDLNQEIEVIHNKKRAFQGRPRRDFSKTALVAAEKADWRGTFEAFLTLK